MDLYWRRLHKWHGVDGAVSVADRHFAGQQIARLLFFGGNGEQADARRQLFGPKACRLVLAKFAGNPHGLVGAAANEHSGGLELGIKAGVVGVAPQFLVADFSQSAGGAPKIAGVVVVVFADLRL